MSGQNTSGGNETQNFCYDELNRLVWAGNSGTQPGVGNGTCGNATLANGLPGANYNTSYAYTHLEQIWQAPLNGKGSSQQYLYCGSQPHQLTGIYPTGTTCSNASGSTAAYSAKYDSWGNMVSRSNGTVSATLSYDVFDHLVQWNSTDSSNATNALQEWYAYDAKGNRVLLRSSSGGTTSITTYPFSLEEHTYDATGNATGNTYYYLLDKQPIGQSDGTHTQFLLTDELGSVLTTFSNTPGSAVVLANQAYGPYGNKQYSAGTMGTAKGFTGQYSDPTGLDYYNARYYDPIVGIFISADTVQGNPQGLDPYTYVGDNPETKNDPTGHDGSDWWQQLQQWWDDVATGGPTGRASVDLSKFFTGQQDTFDPKDLQVLTNEEVINQIPKYATVREMTPDVITDPKTGETHLSNLKGLEFKWIVNGYLRIYRTHGKDTNVSKDTNAGKGQTGRFTRERVDENGNPIPGTYEEYGTDEKWYNRSQLTQVNRDSPDPVIERNINAVHQPTSELSDEKLDYYLNNAGFRKVMNRSDPPGRAEDDPRYREQEEIIKHQEELDQGENPEGE